MKAALYCRLSEEDKNKRVGTDDSASIQNQKTMLTHYAKANGWEIYGIYSDDDYTGADRNRPEFNRLLRDAENGKFDIILCKTQSRFTRELEMVEKYIHGLFPFWGIRFISIVDNADTDNKGNKKSRQINGLVNEWYLEDMSENIRSVLKSRRENGFHIGSFALYGYKKDPMKRGHLIIDDDAAKIVREVFFLFSQGHGKTSIARQLNERGIPNPTEYKRLKGMRYRQSTNKNSTLWRYSAISNMLKNEMYIGNMVQGKYGSISYKTKQNKPRPESEWYRVEGTHEPIIDRVLWDKVQTIICDRTKPFSTGNIGLFAGKIFCSECGYAMRSSKSNGKHYLRCSSRYTSKNACQGSFISAERLEEYILTELHAFFNTCFDRDKLEQSITPCPDLQNRKDQIISETEYYHIKAKEYSECIKNLYVDKINGLISQKDFLLFSGDFFEQRRRIEQIISNLETKTDEIEKELSENENSHATVEKYIHLKHLTRNMVEELINHITVGKRAKGSRDMPIEIYWKF